MAIYKKVSDSLLPNAYQQVEYIESTGTQYINTGFTPTSSTYAELDARIQYSGSGYGFFGVGNPRFHLDIRNESELHFGVGGNNDYGFYSCDMTARHVFGIKTSGEVYLDGEQVDKCKGGQSYTGYTCAIFSKYNGSYLGVLMKLYACQIYNNGALVRDFIPCYRKSDNVIGLYDLVNNVFYTNQGTGTFLKGNNVAVMKKVVGLYKGTTQIVKRYKGTSLIYSASRLPSAYQEVEYIESTGTQYIDTGVVPTGNIDIDIDITLTSQDSTANVFIGIGNNSVQGAFSIFSSSQNKLVFVYNQVDSSHLVSLDNNHQYNIRTNGGKIYLDNTLVYTARSDGGTFSGLLNMYLFARNESGTASYYTNAKLYSCQIYNNNTLVRDFIPCYRKSDNVIGLYDLVNDVFYTNRGTGTFIKGNDV